MRQVATLFAVTLCIGLGLGISVWGYTKLMGRLAPGTASAMAAPDAQADLILVFKAEKRLELWRGDRLLRSYPIAMGKHWQAGHKQREGDERTPEGRYHIDWRNARSMAHLSLHISYPNAADSAAAAARGEAPGGNIMIHGLPNGWGALAPWHHLWDWTDGCIAVTNAQIREIWSLVPNGTVIEIMAQES